MPKPHLLVSSVLRQFTNTQAFIACWFRKSMLFQFHKADFDCYFPFDNMQLFTQNINELSIHQLDFFAFMFTNLWGL